MEASRLCRRTKCVKNSVDESGKRLQTSLTSEVLRLRLAANQLSTLPESIGQLSELKECGLSVGHSHTAASIYSAVDSVIDLAIWSSCEELFLGFNPLESLPESMSALTALEEASLVVADAQICNWT